MEYRGGMRAAICLLVLVLAASLSGTHAGKIYWRGATTLKAKTRFSAPIWTGRISRS